MALVVVDDFWAGEVSLLVAIGVNGEGYREIFGICKGAKEDKAGWSGFLIRTLERAAHWSSMDEVQRAAPKSKVLNRFRRQVAFVKFIGTHTEYDRIEALTVSQCYGDDAWKSGRSAPRKITKPRSPKLRPAGVHSEGSEEGDNL